MKKKVKLPSFRELYNKIRKPIAPPTKKHKSTKDYDRKRDKKIPDEY